MFKELFGLNAGEPIEPYAAKVDMGNQEARPCYVLSDPSTGIPMINYDPIGEGYVTVRVQQPSGEWSVGQVHISRLTRE